MSLRFRAGQLFGAPILLILGGVALLAIGCSRQPEGARCSLLNADSDCGGNLECTPASTLRDGGDGVDRCCPEAGEGTEDDRCIPRISGGGSGGSPAMGGASAGGEAGAPGSDPVSGIGDACNYDSDCLLPLVCGPSGLCQPECVKDRDCPAGEVCSEEQICEPG